jgi:YHS domain-containing protein
MRKSITAAMIFAFSVAILSGTLAAKDTDKGDQPALLCPVMGKAVNADVTTEYNGGTVAFCCPGCLKKFNADTEKYATKANLQLTQGGQAEQVACPISGRGVNPDQTATVAGVEVAFCCGGCKGKVNGAEGDEQLDLVYGSEAFTKGFKVAEKEEK